MRFRLVVWLLLFVLGLFVGDRYGLPGWARSAADGAFSSVEGWFGRLGEPIPESDAPIADEAAETTGPVETITPPATPASGDLGNAANAGLHMNDAGLQIIKDSESLRLDAYSAGGQWLIGYGHSRTAQAGMTITEAQAEKLLREDVRASEDAVKKMVLVPLNENQFSALVSLAYNMGSGGFSRSTVLAALNQGDYAQAADNFRNHNRGGGQVIAHLTERREKERALFLTPA
ncbi:lysozyme [Hyphococcus sp.]|jgi:lysozyme|uniref:lysozyme n=1 Tax=Hyphococcus sp. TaxID=2038636 RepID=UPI003D10F2E7